MLLSGTIFKSLVLHFGIKMKNAPHEDTRYLLLKVIKNAIRHEYTTRCELRLSYDL